MTNTQNTPKNTDKKEGLAALCSLGPRVRCRFDNGQEYFAKSTGEALFSWHVKGDFTLPLLPFAVGLAAASIAVASFLHDGIKKG